MQYICHYWYLLNKGFTFEPYIYIYIYSVCHGLLMVFVNLGNIYILNRGADYHFGISKINRNKTIILMQNIDITEKK